MKVRFLLLVLFALPFTLFSQVYKFNRQTIITFESERKHKTDTWTINIEIEVQKKIIIMRRPSNGAGEKPTADTLRIDKRTKNDDYTKYVTNDDRIILISGDELITMVTKETRDHKRIEYVFYNQKD